MAVAMTTIKTAAIAHEMIIILFDSGCNTYYTSLAYASKSNPLSFWTTCKFGYIAFSDKGWPNTNVVKL